MLKGILNHDKYTVLIALLCLFHLIGNISWLSLNKTPFPWDQAGHTIIAFKFVDYFTGENLNQNFLSISDYYPPFVHLVTAFFMLIFGKNILIGPLVVTGFFILAIVFLYLYTNQLFKDRPSALSAATLFSFLPNIYALSREFLLEIPLVAMVLGALYFLEKSDHLHNRKTTLIFAIFVALALSIKWTAAIFLFIPVIFKLKKIWPKVEWTNWLLIMGVVLFINLPWYIYNLSVIVHAAKFTATAEAADPQIILSFENFKYYFFMITNFQLTWVGMLAFLFGAVFYVLKANKESYLLLLTYLFIYLVFTLIGNKDLRYVIFLACFSVMIISFALMSQRKIITVIFGLILFAFYLFYYFSLSFGILVNPLRADFRPSVKIPLLGWIDIINLGKDTSHFLAPIYNQTIWPNEVIVKELNRHNPKKTIKTLLICEKPFFNQVNMELIRRQLNFGKMHFFAPYELDPFPNEQLLEKYLTSFDVIMVADKSLGTEGGIRYIQALKQIQSYLKSEKSQNIVKINNYFLPDQDTLHVYKPKADPK